MITLTLTCRATAFCRAVALVGWLGYAVFCPLPARAETVVQGFAKAQRAAESGHPKAAVQILSRLLKRYPDHEASRLLLAHLYYGMGQFNKAALQYRRLPPSVVTTDNAYEYGVSFFTTKDCPRAVRGFNKVAAKSQEINLAYFYLGICALNAYECQKAEVLLGKARDLPPKLEATRRKALAKADPRSCQAPPPVAPQPGTPVATAPPAFYGFPASGEAVASLPAVGTVGPPPPAAAGTDKVDVGVSTFIEPGLYLKQRNKTANYFGFKNGYSQTLNEDISLRLGGRYDLPPIAPGGFQSYVAVEAFTAQDWGQTNGSNESYVTQSSQPGTIFSQSSPVPPGSTHVLLLSLEGKGGYALRPLVLLFAGDKILEALPDIDFGKSIMFNEIYAGTSYGDKILATTLRLSDVYVTMRKLPPYGPVSLSNSDDQVYNNFTGSALAATLDLLRNWDAYSLQGKVNYTAYQPNTGYYMGGDTAHTRVEVVATDAMKLGLKLTAAVSYQISSQYNAAVPDPSGVKGAPSVKATASQANSYSVLGQAELKPVDWCFGMLSYRYTSFSFSGLDPAYSTAFQQATAQVSTTFTLQIGLDKKF